MTIKDAIAAYATFKTEANAAYAIYCDHCEGRAPPRVPGMDTVIRLAFRLSLGRSIEESAALEYVYRWRLAIKAPDQCLTSTTRNPCVSIFGAPHTIGM